MPIRFFFIILGCLFTAYRVESQSACTKPVSLSGLVINNTTCGNSTGFIIISVSPANEGYTFTWNPNISTDNSAFNLGAGAYRVRIARKSEPECVLDTTFIINNTDGPFIQAANILPANCTAANGSISLTPVQLNYQWSTDEAGATNTDLPSGCYTVTATGVSGGCYSVHQFCVPNVNPLAVQADVLDPAKCNRATGKALITATGGSGAYLYSLTGLPQLNALPAGNYAETVTDINTGCRDTVFFTVPGVSVTGTVEVQPFNIRCPGNPGYVFFDVLPGNYFELPFVFSLVDPAGKNYSPGALTAGTYYLQVADADSCVLPIDTFTIEAPPAFNAQITRQAGDCDQGGLIQLGLSGGNGRYIIDWQDMAGFSNPRDRFNLKAGYYTAWVYDSLFCRYILDSLYIPIHCAVPDTLSLILGVNSVDSLCFPPPVGVAVSEVDYQLVGTPGSNTGSSAFGSWVLEANGCFTYISGKTPGWKVDNVLVSASLPQPGLGDTVCVQVSVTARQPERDTVYFAVQAGSFGTACAVWPDSFIHRQVSLTSKSGLNGAADAYGTYMVDPLSGCLTFFATQATGYNVAYIDVALCDLVLNRCKVVTFIPTVLSPTGCADGISLPANFIVETAECQVGAPVCLPIPFGQLFDYVIVDNGAPYIGFFEPCSPDTVLTYKLQLPPGGPYKLDEWKFNGQSFSGYFSDIFELVNYVNKLDPQPGWSLQNNSVLVGGKTGQSYGNFRVLSAFGDTIQAQPVQASLPLGTLFRFKPGEHRLLFRRLQTGCIDSLRIQVVCVDCPPFHSYTPDAQGIITLQASSCDGQGIFCTGVAVDNLPTHTINVNGKPFADYINCESNRVGLKLDTGSYVLFIRNELTECEEERTVKVVCLPVQADTTLALPDDTLTLRNLAVVLPLYENDLINGQAGNLAALASASITETPTLGTAVFDPATGLLTYTPRTGACGVDRLRYSITDNRGRKSEALVTIRIQCEKVLVYTGISPNGDGANDQWHIEGIESYPGNRVQVFNRWGNRVYDRSGYKNAEGWDGRWNGRDLPDGAYFYIIDLGKGEQLSGYIQLQR